MKIRFEYYIEKMPKLIQMIYWLIIDFKRRKYQSLHIYGIELIVGLYGQGKTMALSHYLDSMRQKYGDNIYISTNYFFKGQDFPITHWKDLIKEYDKPIIFGYDEIQNEFNSRDYTNFPIELLTLLTQNRKGFGKKIIGTAQRYNRVDKVFRELAQYVLTCHTVFGRLTIVRKYEQMEYEELLNSPVLNKQMNIKPRQKYSFVQSDRLRDLYDSFKMLESAKSKEYISRQERVSMLSN